MASTFGGDYIQCEQVIDDNAPHVHCANGAAYYVSNGIGYRCTECLTKLKSEGVAAAETAQALGSE